MHPHTLYAIATLAFVTSPSYALKFPPSGNPHGSGGGNPSLPSNEEFVGPFASWMCARTAASGTCGTAAAAFCNAAGNGVTDDTTAVQNCINSLTTSAPVV